MADQSLSPYVAISVWSPSGGNAPLAVGTLIENDTAVTIAGALPPTGEFRVAFGDEQSSERSGVSRDELPGLGLVAIHLSPGRDALPLAEPAAGECESAFPVGDPIVRSGLIQFVGNVPYAQFKDVPNQPSLVRGAPIVSNGMLVGVLGEKNEIISATAIAAALHPDEFDEAAAFAALDSTAHRVLDHARGMAGGRNRKVHAEHLILGLNENPASTTRRLLASRALDDAALRELILQVLKSKPLGENEYVAETLTALPAMSAHVRRAIGIGRAVAMRNRGPIRPRHLLFGLLSIRDCEVPQALEKRGIRAADVQLKDTTRISGYVSDTADGRDRLGIYREACALAAVLGASKVEPPIAVGLLGTWGSGKSFFMHELQRQLVEVECRGRAGDAEACSNIVQIWFNAWHYIDTSLWASVTSTIFDSLDEQLEFRENRGRLPADAAADKRAQVHAAKAKLESERDAVAAQRIAAEKELAAVAAATTAVEKSDEEVVRRAGTATIEELAQKTTEEQQTATQKARLDFAARFGVDQTTVTSFRGTFGRLRAVALAVRKMNGWRVWALLLLAAAGAAAAMYAPALVTKLQQWLVGGAGGAAVISAVTWLVTQAKKYRPEVDALLDQLEPIIRKKDDVVAAVRKQQLAQLAEQNNAAAARVAELRKNEAQLEQRVQASETELVSLRPMKQMKSFIRERRESRDYTQHLGVISKAHQDFDRLSRYLRTVTRPDANGEPTALVDRIVLYIDDLDRCPEEKVVDVLQAVHLLLAFPLFVVVVGVDSPWLLHSLQARMKQFGGTYDDRKKNDIDENLWESTPINYLEKIFQIPFTLRQMEPSGFGDLIDDLTIPTDTQAQTRGASSLPTASAGATASPSGTAQRDTSGGTAATESGSPAAGDGAARLSDATPTAHLSFTPEEVAYMKSLFPLISSPRGAKRFVNLYRLFRGVLDDYRYAAYVATNERQYEAALLLLAMLIGFPEETTVVLEALVNTKPSGTWWDFVMPLMNARNDPRSVALAAKLAQIREKVKRPSETFSCAPFVLWAPEIARYSFHSGRVIFEYRVRAAAASSPVVPGPGPVAPAQPIAQKPARV